MRNGLAATFIATLIALWASGSQAAIYSWMDENGVKHFSNRPPAQAPANLQRTDELPFDDRTGRSSGEASSLEIAARTWQEINRAQEQSIRLQRETERRIAEANRRAREAEQRAQTLEERSESDAAPILGYILSGYPHRRWPARLHRPTPYYRRNASIFYGEPDDPIPPRRRLMRPPFHPYHTPPVNIPGGPNRPLSAP
jgi:hypothetical protein